MPETARIMPNTTQRYLLNSSHNRSIKPNAIKIRPIITSVIPILVCFFENLIKESTTKIVPMEIIATHIIFDNGPTTSMLFANIAIDTPIKTPLKRPLEDNKLALDDDVALFVNKNIPITIRTMAKTIFKMLV